MTLDRSDLSRPSIRGRLEAAFLSMTSEGVHRMHGRRKAAVLGELTGTVVEIGAGTGVNLRYYRPGVRLLAVEPNPAMLRRLREEAERCRAEVEIRPRGAEQLDLPDRSADAVVCTLVLCGVPEPGQVLAEAHRVLRPGGILFLLEHVVAPPGSRTRTIQRLVKRPHRWCFNGCEVDRDTAALLAASPFDDIDLERVDIGAGGLYTRHHIIGTARRSAA